MGDAVTRQTTSERAEPAHAYDLFVVYAATDAEFVRGYLLPALNLPSSRVRLVDDLPIGGVIVAEIDRGVTASRFTVAVLSPAYLADRWAVFGEQLASHLSVDDTRIIPLRLTACDLPLRLDARVSLDFTDSARWDAETGRLRDLVHAPPPAPEPIACPYPGMRAFAAADVGRFFGRDAEVDDLVGRLDRGEHMIYVIGPSGSGKSSLVQAGLLPVIEAGTSRLGRTFVTRTMRPGERPAERLAHTIDGDLATPVQAIEAFVARHPPAERALVVIDQLEELFTVATADERRRFIAALEALRANTPCCFVLALRADFYGALMDSELWPQRAGLSRLDIAPLRGPALAEAITAPAMRVGVHLEARLSDRLVTDAAGEPGVLPLVQETLRMLWDRRRHRYLGLAAYEALGQGGRGLDVAIALRANTAMNELTDPQQAIARRVLLRLVSFGEGRADTRRQLNTPALRTAAGDEAALSHVLQHLVAHRLITVDGDLASESTAREALVDLSHEALITGWPEFRRWIDERRADEQRRRRLEGKVDEWIERGRGTASLLDAVELVEAVQWIASDAARELGHPAELADLVTASWAMHGRQRRRRRGLVGVAFVVLAAFAAFMRYEANNAHEQTDRAEASDRESKLQLAKLFEELGRQELVEKDHPQEAIPYFLEARRNGLDTPPLRMMFGSAARRLPLVPALMHQESMVSAAFSPDGTRVVTASEDGTARVWDAATGQPVTSPLAHQDIVKRAAFSPDGTRVVTASEDGTARVWDAATGKPVTSPLAHQNRVFNALFSSSVWSAAFSPDGTRVVTASNDGTARVWDAATGQPVTSPLVHRGSVVSAAFSPDGTRVVTASLDHTARVWDAATGQPVTHPRVCQGIVESTAFSPDGTRVVTASEDGTARVWDAATGQPVTSSLVHRGSVVMAAFSPDGTRVVTASKDKTARVWDAATGQPVTSPLAHQARVGSAAFSPDGTRVVTASWDKTARVWDAATGQPVTSPLTHQGIVESAAFSPDGTRVVTASDDGTARVWSAATGTPVTSPLAHQGIVVSAAFSPDGTRVMIASDDGTTRMWDAETGKSVTSPLAHQANVKGAAFSPDGTRVMIASWNGTARVWDAATGQPITRPLAHQDSLGSTAFSPDGTRVVTASDDGTARVWDAATGAPVTRPLAHQDIVVSAAFSPDGTRVVTGSADGTARVWDAATGKPVTSPLAHQNWLVSAAFSPDGTHVVTASLDYTARVWDAATGKAVTSPLAHLGRVRSAAFSPDGTRVVTASDDGTARVWDAATGKPITSPLAHQDRVGSAAFSPDGTRVVTASEDGTARVWDAATGQPVTSPLAHQGIVVSAAFSPDGTRVVTASYHGTARVWGLPLDNGTLEQWCLVAERSPFILNGTVLVPRPRPSYLSPANDSAKEEAPPPRSPSARPSPDERPAATRTQLP